MPAILRERRRRLRPTVKLKSGCGTRQRMGLDTTNVPSSCSCRRDRKTKAVSAEAGGMALRMRLPLLASTKCCGCKDQLYRHLHDLPGLYCLYCHAVLPQSA